MVVPRTISGVVPFIVASVAKSIGFDPATLLSEAGIDPGARPRADEHVPIERYFEVWRRVMAKADEAFPLRVASAFTLEDHEVFGFLAMSCETLGHAYERTASYRALYAIGARWDIDDTPEGTRLTWFGWDADDTDAGVRAANVFAVADMAKDIRRLGRLEPRPLEVRSNGRLPADLAPFVAHFGVAPIDAPLYSLVYERGLTAQPIATFNSRLRDYFDAECARLVEKLGAETSLVVQVRKLLIAAMDGGDIDIEKVAKQLAMSSRSLQRRLGEEGTKFNDLLAEVRSEFAKRYLARGSISASEVAYLLGFTEPPAFFKAFKRWTGMTPKEFQQGAAA